MSNPSGTPVRDRASSASGATLLADVRLWALLCLGFVTAGVLPAVMGIDLDLRIDGARDPAWDPIFDPAQEGWLSSWLRGGASPALVWTAVAFVGLACLLGLVPIFRHGLRRGPPAPVSLLGRDLFTVLLAWLLLQIVSQVILAMTAWRGQVDPVVFFQMLGVADLAVVAMIAGVLWRRFGRVDLRVFERSGDAGINLGFATVAYVVFVPALLALGAALEQLATRLGLPPPSQEVAEIVRAAATRGPLAIAVVGVVIVLVIPFTEELLFRGLVLTTLKKWMGRWPAIVLSALAFTLVHVERGGYAPMHLVIFALALFLGAIFERTGQLRTCILVHALHNYGQLVITLGMSD